MVWQEFRTWKHACEDGAEGDKPARVAIEDPGSNIQHQSAGCTQQPQHRVPADCTQLPQNTLISEHCTAQPCWPSPASCLVVTCRDVTLCSKTWCCCFECMHNIGHLLPSSQVWQ